MALINPCSIETAGENTGVECGKSLAAPKGVILVPASAKWQEADLEDFLTYITTKIHASKSQRWYPIFADVVNIENSEEADTLESFPSGATSFVKYGPYSRTFSFAAGGTCLAKALMSFNKLGYRFIEVDINGRVSFRKNSDGSYGGLKPNELYSPKPKLQDFTTSYLNKLYVNINPEELIKNAIIFESEEDLSDLMGLLDAKVLDGDTASTTTHLYVRVVTECAETDLVELLGSDFASEETNFVVTKVSDGTAVTVTGSALQGTSEVALAGTFVSATHYNVALAAPSVLLGNDVEGYEGVVAADVSF